LGTCPQPLTRTLGLSSNTHTIVGMTVVVDQPAPDALVRRLESEVAEVAGVLNAAHGRLVELTAELIETDAWRGWGTRSIEHWLVWQGRVSPHHAGPMSSQCARRVEH